MIARKTAPNCTTEIAVGRLLAHIIARGHGDNFFVAGVPVIIHALVAVTGGETNHAALSGPAVLHGEINRKPSAVGKRNYLLMDGIIRVFEVAISRSPAARDHIGPVLCRPEKPVGLLLRSQRHIRTNWNQPRPRRYAGRADISVGAGHAGAGVPMPVPRARPRVVIFCSDVAWRHNLPGGTKFFMLNIEAIIDYRDEGTGAVTQRPSRFDVRMLVHRVAADVRCLQVPLLGKRLPRTLAAHKFGMTKLHILLREKSRRDGKNFLAGPFLRLMK